MATINADKLIKRLNHIANMDLHDAMTKAVTFVHAQAKVLAPVDNGELAGSIRMEVKDKSKGVVGRVYTSKQYAPYVEFGTGIKGNGTYPNKNVSLSYRSTPWVYTPDGGETFYRTEGQVAQPYMYPAIKRNEKYIKSLFKQGVSDVVRGGK